MSASAADHVGSIPTVVDYADHEIRTTYGFRGGIMIWFPGTSVVGGISVKVYGRHPGIPEGTGSTPVDAIMSCWL